jgi:DNA helicase-4
MTAHSSKGLGYDDVVILNTKNERYGFPSKLEDDPLLKLVLKEDRSYDYAEERRLFYVAMTRTKNRVWMIAPSDHPSEFLLELMDDYDNVKLEGHLSRSPVSSDPLSKRCPVCGYPMKLRFHKAFGLPLYLCSNEPEVCGFLTNDLAGGRMNIMRCDCCRDGYLIIKRNRKSGQVFWGCTNYLPNGKGCNRTISR